MMRKFNYLLIGALMSAFGLFVACSSSDDTTSNNGGGGNAPVTPVVPVDPTLTDAYLCGFVRNAQGNVIANATVTTGSATTTTDQNGFFEFKRIKIVDGRVVVKFSTYGYQDVVRSFAYKAGEVWDVILTENYNYGTSTIPTQTAYYQSTEEKSIAVTNTSKEMKVDLQKDGYKDAETGAAYTGAVNATVTYLNPDDEENFADRMPGGDLAAKDQNGEIKQLVSYGMTCVTLEGSGKKLQLADGKEATVTFPIPDNLKDDPRVVAKENIPLWSFNEENGLWEYEGEAVYNAEVDGYVGTVRHFSWANLDWPSSRATVKGKVTDGADKPIVHQKVRVGQTTAYTDEKGEYSCFVPTYTNFIVSVRGSDYGNYTSDGSAMITEEVTSLEPGAVKVVNIQLPSLYKVTGTIKNNGTGGNAATVWIEYTYNGYKRTSRRARSNSDGSFTILAPTFATGAATIHVTSSDGVTIQKTITLSGGDIDLGTIEILSNDTGTGKLTVTVKGTGQSFSFDIPNVDPYSFGGVMVRNDGLYCNIESRQSGSGYNFGWTSGGLEITSGFSLNKTDYSNVFFQYGGEIMNPEASDHHDGYMLNVSSDKEYYSKEGARTINATVIIQNGKATFTFNGDVFLSYHSFSADKDDKGIEPEGDTPNATLTGSFTIDVFYIATTVAQTTNSDSRIPSWVPKLDDKEVINAFFITSSSKLGKGAAYSYDGDYSDYKSLVSKAEQLGYVLYEFNDVNSWYSSFYTFFKGDKYLKLYYDTNAQQERTSFFAHGGRIDVYAFDGSIFDVADYGNNSWSGPFVKQDKTGKVWK